jgi:hypothetical protein
VVVVAVVIVVVECFNVRFPATGFMVVVLVVGATVSMVVDIAILVVVWIPSYTIIYGIADNFNS